MVLCSYFGLAVVSLGEGSGCFASCALFIFVCAFLRLFLLAAWVGLWLLHYVGHVTLSVDASFCSSRLLLVLGRRVGTTWFMNCMFPMFAFSSFSEIKHVRRGMSEWGQYMYVSSYFPRCLVSHGPFVLDWIG